MMKLLAIDTSTETASVALLTGTELLCETQNNQRTHAQFILSMIDKVMVNAGVHMNQLDAIVFGRGPGSFTGLRIACSIAKGLAYANDLNLIPVSSLAAIAWSARQKQKSEIPVLAVLDARMQEMYWAYFPHNQWIAEEHVAPVHQLSLSVNEPVILAGVGIDLYWDEFVPEIKTQICEKITVNPAAEAMIQFALFSGQKSISAAQAQPVYVRNKVT
ncbi:tRNA (adenosine(37)-N6)-threonylcarbamoyltransferase complex dimerization subunit type 1 TsaB [Fluoribacter dumoffii]|uniref:tRNA threonylcarbamoyladenosine biosynthesis protein TsaB n=1 Tax=Fluoribacter dumoffii TaxID=463 RepID=A0A377GAF9_9GAMM|nr:tRNA (adenosine(37)-N6)-threonylcarbamoyltransferase complex dimerization subunit type 1 TsaB [Fluoribacter dumoffii]KTC88749.1 glycoprotease [Fluoribacter dumoffii NY 23]MCW8385956.1 tRNA (adenosine(37)-N6)-threonylcarbamoyltransferase complex dimerization subunit type 1 TsaB [Fluoribacter dumoffii]MCW8419009.1 tRNA (adenosine(37)-N6)-threonylcarbamoyltransferase complex dimerization subunit type 1 TsaB [Fluoribacter dumoffii]MCW8453147.1 tRNA (adenosine(37)-N6)-threonylcarbamoyltransferase